ncbi:MAG TPA: LysM peptidoglycan-binding domain-containing protein [Gemmatimonadales bacterium]|nr:LysM peptidoglycan-binding domain-containing protein [Gemmatimonadales bacterium]
MPRVRCCALFALVLLAACGGGRQPPTTEPAPAPVSERAGDQAAPAPQFPADASAGMLPPAPFLDTLIPEAEFAAELRLAADSAADEEVLEALAEASPEGGEGGDAEIAGNDTKSLANAVTWDIDVETWNSHARVRYYLDFFLGKGRNRMGIWLNRLPRYEPMIRERLAQEGMPGDLVYLALIESGFSNTATSRARAVGMWQFMKGTAKHYGLRVDSWVDERRDPYRATDAAVRHLRDLSRRFGSLYLAAAAYNAGSGRVSRGLKRLPDDDEDPLASDATFFRLYDTKLIRRETKDYVPKLIAAALIAKQPARYGFEVTPAVPLTYDSIVVPTMTGLDVIARLADTTVAAVREMNPQYLRLATPPGVASVVRIPAGRGAATVAAYAELPPEKRVTFVEHFVARGETMSGIAKKYRVSQRLLADANPKVKPSRLRPGQRLIVPTGGAISSAMARRMADPAVPAGTSSSGYHRVRRGETLSGIADEYGVTQRDLRAWNSLPSNGHIRAGQRLRVAPPTKSSAKAAKTASDARTHRVRRGETLTGLAKRYGVSVEALREANGLTDDSTLRAGASLRIPG